MLKKDDKRELAAIDMDIRFRKITEFPRGTLTALLKDAYGFEPKFARDWLKQWQAFDDFFYDNPHILRRNLLLRHFIIYASEQRRCETVLRIVIMRTDTWVYYSTNCYCTMLSQ